MRVRLMMYMQAFANILTVNMMNQDQLVKDIEEVMQLELHLL